MLNIYSYCCGDKEGVVTQEKLDALEEGMAKDEVKELLREPQKIADTTKALRVFFIDDELGGTYPRPK